MSARAIRSMWIGWTRSDGLDLATNRLAFDETHPMLDLGQTDGVGVGRIALRI